jgi:HD-like signal output (HDOD) protein
MNVNQVPKTILLVDEEADVLSGLRRIMRRHRPYWEVVTAVGTTGAMAAISRRVFDIVVLDLGQPVDKAIAFLQYLSIDHPSSLRAVLTAEAGFNKVMSTLGSAHIFLTKPFNTIDLIERIDRLFALQRYLPNPCLQAVAKSVRVLPTLPENYQELKIELNSADPSQARISELIEKDPALTSKVLQVVNSGFYSLRYPIIRVLRAVSYLGLEMIASIINGYYVIESLERRGVRVGLEFWQHSTEVAIHAARIAVIENLSKADIDAAFIAGVLHDIGELALFDVPHALMSKPEVREPGHSIAAEQAKFGCDHAAVGSYLLGLWGLPESVVTAVAFHHAIAAGLPIQDPTSVELVVAGAELLSYERSIGRTEFPRPAWLTAERAQRWTLAWKPKQSK